MTPNHLRLVRERVFESALEATDSLLRLPAGTWAKWEDAAAPEPVNAVGEALTRMLMEALLAGVSGEELFIVGQLMARVTQQEIELRNRQGMAGDALAEAEVRRVANRRQLMLHELHTRAYGRVVWVRDIATGQEIPYRFTQANEGEAKLRVIQRQAAIAGELVPAQVGDIVELPPNGREVEVVAIVDLERFPADHLLGKYDTFAALLLQAEALDNRLELGELKAAFAALAAQLRAGVGLAAGAPVEIVSPPRRTRGREEQLSASFFTRSTYAQEKLLRKGASGLTVVLGVAGSGKTSVALGRTKFACDATGKDADPDFFRTNTAAGFVLNEQLSGYLKRAMAELMLIDMGVHEYGAVRKDLLLHRQLDQDGAYKHDTGRMDLTSALEGKMGWLRAADAAIGAVFADRLRNILKALPGEREEGGLRRRGQKERTPAQRASLEAIWDGFSREVEAIAADLLRDSDGWQFRVQGLAARIDRARATFAERLERDPAWSGSDRSDLRQNVRASLRERLIRALRFAEAYAAAVTSPLFTAELARRLGTEPSAEIDRVITRVNEHRLADADVDVLLALAHVASLGYRGRENEKDPISHLAEGTFHSQVFIDEFQDFSEVQLFLMGMLADRTYQSVTVVGDFCQQLTSGQRVDLAACFPWASPADRTAFALLENKRQTPALARMSQRFREVALGDASPSDAARDGIAGAKPRLVVTDDLAQGVFDEVLAMPRDASVAVICPSMRLAETLHAELSSELAEAWRETRIARHAELTSRQYIHFTEAIQTKGLEFDAVVVVEPACFDLGDPAKANALYVALSRPRERLSIVARDPLPAAFKTFVEEALVETVEPVQA